jgi:P2 family phage contractile tail tube protein
VSNVLQKVYNNVEDHRVIDEGRVVGDVTSVGIPTLTKSTTTIDVSGMVMAVDMPNSMHFEATEFSIAHNNGVNGRYLANPGKHAIEVRVARQSYNVATGVMEHKSVKFRLTGVHKETDKGSVETGNPLGSTEKYSLMRYEEEIEGEIVTIIDSMAGIIKFNGESYTDEVENLLA